MDNRIAARVGALRRYIAFIRHEGDRLNRVKASANASELDRADAAVHLRAIVHKISSADKDLRLLELRRRAPLNLPKETVQLDDQSRVLGIKLPPDTLALHL